AGTLIEGDDQSVIGLRAPFGIGAQLTAKPLIAALDGTVVHVVIEVRADEADRRQFREIARKPGKVLLGVPGLAEGLPGIVLAWRTLLDIADEAATGSLTRTPQR